MKNLRVELDRFRIWPFSLIVGCMMAALSQGSLKANLVLVEDGQPRATIVVQPDQPKAVQAAEALQKYFEQMSGAKLPVVSEGEPAQGVLILVGDTAKARQLGVAIPSGYDASVRDDSFEEEGYVLKTFDGAVVVAGNNDGPYYGTVYAAYALLQELGCRWYFPGDWGEVVPERSTVELPTLDVTSRPDFAVRNIWLSGWIPTSAEEREIYQDWCLKIGFTQNRNTMYPVAGDGFLAYLLPPKEYFDEHPEYYAMNEAGQRHVPDNRYERHTMLCLSNPQVYDQSVANLRAAFAGKTESNVARIVTDNGFGISPPDGTPYCYCEDCQELSQNFNYPSYVHRTMQSEEFFGFAARLAREFPDKFVGTMAYALREMPPQGIDIPRNVFVKYAPISNDVLHPNDTKLWRRAEFVSMLKQWRDRTPHVVIYDYNPGFLTGFFVPERDTENMAVNVPIYKQIDIKGIDREGRKAFMQTWISYYVTSRLLWDADADVDAIKDDFYTTFFGAAAGPHVRAWWDACAQRLVETNLQVHEDFLVNHLYDVAFINRIRTHVHKAQQAVAAGTDKQQKRVEAFALIAEHLEAFAEMTDAEARMDWHAAATAAQRMTDAKLQLSEIDSFFITVDTRRARPYFAEGRKLRFEEHLARTDGAQGTLVAELPLTARFTRDPHNEGVVGQWYSPGHDDAGWDTRNTFFLWDQQEPFLDERGHDYNGYGWYRMQIDVPTQFKSQAIHLHIGGIINEGWVWINGQYAGHKKHRIWWNHNHDLDLDVTKLIQPGQVNMITVRIWNDAEVGGMYRRGYLWSPTTK